MSDTEMRSCYVFVCTLPWVTGADQMALHAEEKDSLSIKTISKQFANAKRSPDIVRYSCRKHRGRDIFLYIRWTQDLLCNRRAPDLLTDLAAISVHNPPPTPSIPALFLFQKKICAMPIRWFSQGGWRYLRLRISYCYILQVIDILSWRSWYLAFRKT